MKTVPYITEEYVFLELKNPCQCTAATATDAAKSLQLCPTLCDPIDGSPPGSAVPGILQARTLEWVAISFSNAWEWKVKVKSLSRVRLFTTPWTTAYQAPPSMEFFQARVLEWVAIAFSTEIHLILLNGYMVVDNALYLLKWSSTFCGIHF